VRYQISYTLYNMYNNVHAFKLVHSINCITYKSNAKLLHSLNIRQCSLVGCPSPLPLSASKSWWRLTSRPSPLWCSWGMEGQPHSAPSRQEQPGHLTPMCQSRDWENQVGLEGPCGIRWLGWLDQGLHVKRPCMCLWYQSFTRLLASCPAPKSIHVYIYTHYMSTVHITKLCKPSLLAIYP
jgi:hypothetical protein